MTKELADKINERFLNPQGVDAHVRATMPTGTPIMPPPEGTIPSGGAKVKGNQTDKPKG